MKCFSKTRAISFKFVTRWGNGGVVGVFAFGMIGGIPELIEAVRHPAWPVSLVAHTVAA